MQHPFIWRLDCCNSGHMTWIGLAGTCSPPPPPSHLSAAAGSASPRSLTPPWLRLVLLSQLLQRSPWAGGANQRSPSAPPLGQWRALFSSSRCAAPANQRLVAKALARLGAALGRACLPPLLASWTRPPNRLRDGRVTQQNQTCLCQLEAEPPPSHRPHSPAVSAEERRGKKLRSFPTKMAVLTHT